jgi:hypothetical protein
MSVSGLYSDSAFNPALLNPVANKAMSATSGGAGGVASLLLNVASFKSQMLSFLTGAAENGENSGKNSAADAATALPGSTVAGASGLSATGRNLSLFDPESGYRMMSLINNNDVAYKAQFSELSQMKSYLSGMQQAAQGLGSIDTTTDNAGIKAQLQNFATQYNDWMQRFDADMSKDGVLAGTQAAQVSRYELDQSIENVFNGAKDGVNGMADLGLTIDPTSKRAVFDSARLDAVLGSNKQGAVATVQQFSANFAKSAELLNSDGNFIPNQLDNLNRAIHYIDDNHASLQAEFGLGDSAKPNGQVAQALLAYSQMAG